MKKFIQSIFRKVYETGHFAYLAKTKKEREANMHQNAIISENCFLGSEARIRNSLADQQKIKIGNGTTLRGYLLLYKHGGEIIIGDDCYIGDDTRIWSAKKIQVGHRVLIAHNVNIHDNNSHPLDAHLRHLDFVHIREKGLQDQVDLREKEIIIEDDVWIGFNSTIFKGVKIGRGAIIGACTVITNDVPANAIVAGNPAKIIRYNN